MKKYAPILSFLIIISVIYWSFADMKPSYSENKTASETEFSIDNALKNLKEISKTAHYTGSEDHLKVQNYIVNELKKLGLQPEIQHQVAINNKWRAATNTANIIATIKGSEIGKSLVLLTHYDSNPHSSLGASDAGSGVVTIIESVRAFLAQHKTPKNDIHIVITDAEELGLLGAKAFVDKHPLAKNVGLVLNFEARGSGGPSYMLMETNGKNSKLLTEFLKAKPNHPAANSLMYSVYKMLPNDTDLTVFRENGNINGFNFAFIGDHFDYHTAQDSFERLDRETLLHQADYLMTSLNYFAFSDLSNLDSTSDHVYTNFPFTKLLYYPFLWILPLLIGAIVLLFVLLFFGIALNKITIKGLLKGFTPFTISLVACVGISILLWKGILLIHPHYKDILHGFTYNGYEYIAAFVLLNLWLLFKIYRPFLKNNTGADLIIAPILFWLIINVLIFIYLKGAGYFIIPVYFALITLAAFIFIDIKRTTKIAIATILAIPVLFMFAPQVKMFPVGLGLKNLFISGLFLVLIFGLMIPVFASYKSRKLLVKLIGISTILFFAFASYKSGFDENKKKPNSAVFINNVDTNQSYWASYDSKIDTYTKQFLGENPTKGNFTGTTSKSKYNTSYKFHKKTGNRAINPPLISKVTDTIIGNFRNISLMIKPQRAVNKLELIANDSITFNSIGVQNVLLDKEDETDAFKIKRGTILSYFLAAKDSILKVDFTINKNSIPNISLIESSFDLQTNPLFKIQPRTNEMMPMPFVTNDAVITLQKLKL
ncbi:M20/M25/M40 family metallo-hydrolase [Polaribacter gochangensis]|uniref:M20/M25/M40 family metallo-hydrolase n=1 Tax=Polaribacter gochangensis TaxID=3252903 RepID=UPI003904A896